MDPDARPDLTRPAHKALLPSISRNEVSPNNFVETTLSYALTYVDRVAPRSSGHSIGAARLVILADNDYYSQTAAASGEQARRRFAKFPVPLSRAHKTGLGSSAALVTSLTASLLSHYLPRHVFDVSTPAGRTTLHNLAQAAHSAAQGKVGSGFDVAAAVYGSCTYRRFSPDLLRQLPEPGAPGFGEGLARLVDGAPGWDVDVDSGGPRMPRGVALRMCDVDCGSQSVGMARRVLEWRGRDAEASTRLWDDLQARNDGLAAALRDGARAELPAAIRAVRALVREMGRLSDVPIEPEAQTQLLDAVSAVDGVYGGVVPGAGGYDAVALVVDDDDETRQRLDARLAEWCRDKGARVRLLDVKGETEGVRREELNVYAGWL